MKTFFLCVICVSAAANAAADTIKFKNGQIVECQVLSYEKSKLSALIAGEKKELRITTIDSFRLGPNEDPAPKNEEYIILSKAEVGQNGFIKPTLRVVTSEDGQFIANAKSAHVIVRGVNTSGLVTGKWVRLAQRMKVTGTETLEGGQTLFVLEPFDPAQTVVLREEDPALSNPANMPLRVRDVRD